MVVLGRLLLKLNERLGLINSSLIFKLKGFSQRLIKHKDHNNLVLRTGLQGLQAGISGAQTGIQGAGMGLQGVQGAQAGFGLVGRMGEQAANIGSQRQQADLSRLGFQGQMGEQQQQQQQQIINQSIQDYALSQEMPMQRLAGYNALLRGYATPTTTTQQYQAAPNALQQLAGLGTTAAGIGTLMGGAKKKAA
jgi:hypothetical protein